MIYPIAEVLTKHTSDMCESPIVPILILITSVFPQKGRVIGRAHLLIRWLTCSSCWWHAAPRSGGQRFRVPSFYVIIKRNNGHSVRHPCKDILKNCLTSIFGSIIDSCALRPKIASSGLGFSSYNGPSHCFTRGLFSVP